MYKGRHRRRLALNVAGLAVLIGLGLAAGVIIAVVVML